MYLQWTKSAQVLHDSVPVVQITQSSKSINLATATLNNDDVSFLGVETPLIRTRSMHARVRDLKVYPKTTGLASSALNRDCALRAASFASHIRLG
jgi:hypothetical protein